MNLPLRSSILADEHKVQGPKTKLSWHSPGVLLFAHTPYVDRCATLLPTLFIWSCLPFWIHPFWPRSRNRNNKRSQTENMSRIACAWAELGEDAADANQWYEGTHIPAALAKIKSTARHAEQVEDNAFKEIAGIDGRLMTIYELPKQPSAPELDTQISPALDKLPKEARIETRFYKEYANWYGEEWRGGMFPSGHKGTPWKLTPCTRSPRYPNVDRSSMATRPRSSRRIRPVV